MAAESPPQLQNIEIETIGFANLNNPLIISEVVEEQPLRKYSDTTDDKITDLRKTSNSDIPEDTSTTETETPYEEIYRPVLTVTKNEVTLTKPEVKLQKITVIESVDNVNANERANSTKSDEKIEYIKLGDGRNIISEVPDGPFIIRDKEPNNGDNVNIEKAAEPSDRGGIDAIDTKRERNDGPEEVDKDNEKPEIEVKEQEEEVVYNKPVSKLPKRIPVNNEKKEITKNVKGDAISTAQEYLPPSAYIGRPNIFSETPSNNHAIRHEPPPKPVSKIPKLYKHDVKTERKVPIVSKKDTKIIKDPVNQTDNAIKIKSIVEEKPVKEETTEKTRKTLKEKILKVVTIRNNGRPEVSSDTPMSPHEMRGNIEFKEKDDGEKQIVVPRRPKEHKSNELVHSVVPVERNSVIIDQIINSQVPDEIDNIFDELYDSLAAEEALEDLEVTETPSTETENILNSDETPRSGMKEDKPIKNSTDQYAILEINNPAETFTNVSPVEDERNRNYKPEINQEDHDVINRDLNIVETNEYEEINNNDDNYNTPDMTQNYINRGEELNQVHVVNGGDDKDILSVETENNENANNVSSTKECDIARINNVEEENIKPSKENSLQITKELIPNQPLQRDEAIDIFKDSNEPENLARPDYEDYGIETERIYIKEPNNQNESVSTIGIINKIDSVNFEENKHNPNTDIKPVYVKETSLTDITKLVDTPSEQDDTLGYNDVKKTEFDARNLSESVPTEDKTDKTDSPKYENMDDPIPIEIPTNDNLVEKIDRVQSTDRPVQLEQKTDSFKIEDTATPVNENRLNEDIIVINAPDNIEDNIKNEEEQASQEFKDSETILSNDLHNEEPEYDSVYTPILTVTKKEITYSTPNTKLQKITVTEKIENPERYLTMVSGHDNIELPVEEIDKAPISPVIDLSRPNYRETSRLRMKEISERSSVESNRIETKGELKYEHKHKDIKGELKHMEIKESDSRDTKKDMYKPIIVDHVTKKDFKEREFTKEREYNTVKTQNQFSPEAKEQKGITGKVKDIINKIVNKKPEDGIKETKEDENYIKEQKFLDKPAGKVKNVLQRFESKEDLSEPIKKSIDDEPKPVNKKFRHILDRFENKTTDVVEEKPRTNKIEHKTFKNEEDLAREASRGKVRHILKEIESKRDLSISKGKSMENIAGSKDFRRQFSRRKSVSETVAMFEVGKI